MYQITSRKFVSFPYGCCRPHYWIFNDHYCLVKSGSLHQNNVFGFKLDLIVSGFSSEEAFDEWIQGAFVYICGIHSISRVQHPQQSPINKTVKESGGCGRAWMIAEEIWVSYHGVFVGELLINYTIPLHSLLVFRETIAMGVSVRLCSLMNQSFYASFVISAE